MAKTIIIGGGIIGMCAAFYLQQAGHEVEIIDKGDFTDGCSFGNMGYVCPSHFTPLASPGVIAEGMRYMLSSSSPFYIKPRLNLDLLHWVWKFYKSSNAAHVEQASPHLFSLLSLSRQLTKAMAGELNSKFQVYDQGCLMMCKKQKTLDHEMHLADAAEKMGLTVDRLDSAAVQQKEKDVETDVLGAVLYKDDGLIHPGIWMNDLRSYLAHRKVIFHANTTVTGFEKQGNKVSAVITGTGKISCDHLVVAAGSWLPYLAKMLKQKILLQPGKGYSYTYENLEKNIFYPAILMDNRSAISPWGSSLRIGGTMELSGIKSPVLHQRMNKIYEGTKSYYPGLQLPEPEPARIWSGLRPLSPDGLPYLGKLSAGGNVVIAGGHSMLGIALAAGTGLLVQQLLQNQPTEIPLQAFDINRF